MSFIYEPSSFALTLDGPVFLNGRTAAAHPDQDAKHPGSFPANNAQGFAAAIEDAAVGENGVIDLIADSDDEDNAANGDEEREENQAAATSDELGDFVEFTEDILAPAVVQAPQIQADLNKHDPDYKPPWVDMFSGIQSPMLRLHNEIVELCKMLEASDEERDIRQQCVDEVADVVHTIWPGARTEVFGSFATGLYVPTSDIDLVVMDGPGTNVQEALKALANALVRKGVAKNMQVIGKARVPIIKFEGAETGIKFDISFNVPSGPQGAALVKEMLDTWPPMKPLVLMLKVFLQQRDLNEVYSGGLGSYSLITLVASFLQLHISRRSKASDEPKKKRQKTAAGKEKTAGELEGNLGVLFVDMLRTYGRIINTQKVGIACKDGGTYFPKHERGDWINEERPFLLAVEDPADETNDIGRNSFNIMKVRSAFDWAYQLLIAPASPHESLLARVLHLKPVLAGRGKPVWKQPYPKVYSRSRDTFKTPTPHSKRGREPNTAHSAHNQRSDPLSEPPRSDPRDVRSFLPSRQSIASNGTPQVTFRTIGTPYPSSAGGAFGSPTPVGPQHAPMMWRTPSSATPAANNVYGRTSGGQMQNMMSPSGPTPMTNSAYGGTSAGQMHSGGGTMSAGQMHSGGTTPMTNSAYGGTSMGPMHNAPNLSGPTPMTNSAYNGMGLGQMQNAQTPSGPTPMVNKAYGGAGMGQMQNAPAPRYSGGAMVSGAHAAYTAAPSPMTSQLSYGSHPSNYQSNNSIPRSASAPPSRPVTHATGGYSGSQHRDSLERSNSHAGGGGSGSQRYSGGGVGSQRYSSGGGGGGSQRYSAGGGSQQYSGGANGQVRHNLWNGNQAARGHGSQGHNSGGRQGDSRKGHSARLNTHIRFDD